MSNGDLRHGIRRHSLQSCTFCYPKVPMSFQNYLQHMILCPILRAHPFLDDLGYLPTEDCGNQTMIVEGSDENTENYDKTTSFYSSASIIDTNNDYNDYNYDDFTMETIEKEVCLRSSDISFSAADYDGTDANIDCHHINLSGKLSILHLEKLPEFSLDKYVTSECEKKFIELAVDLDMSRESGEIIEFSSEIHS